VTNTQAFLTHHCFGFAFLLSPAFQLLRASIHYTFAILVHQRRELYIYTEVGGITLLLVVVVVVVLLVGTKYRVCRRVKGFHLTQLPICIISSHQTL
jgi:hypothetical protein